MPTSSITKQFEVKDYDAYLRLLRDIGLTKEECEECDHSDICAMLEVPSEEACRAIKSCTKEFLQEEIFNSLDEYFKDQSK